MSKTYTTVQGDMWDSIAYSQLGDASYADKLMNLNTAHLSYYVFPSGILLTLPDAVAAIPDSLPPWRKVVG